MKRMLGFIVAAGLVVGAPDAGAQGFLQVWAGGGSSSQEGSSTHGRGAKQVGVQISVPLSPIALRGDALLLGDGFTLDGLSYNLNVVLRMSLPIVQPYVIAGRGTYSRTNDDKAGGWNIGGGLRIGIGDLGIFGEMRRHTPVKRTITIFGVTF
jgi:hypothetical protein